jgi:hypothetical protein
MLYSKDKGWLFIHVPKNAGTSVQANYSQMHYDHRGLSEEDRVKAREEYHLDRFFIGEQTEHNKWPFFKKTAQEKGLSPVGLLRNPWARCLSIYLFSLNQAHKELGQEWANYDHPILTRQGFKGSWMPGGYFVDGHASHVEYNDSTQRAWAYEDDQFSWLNGEGKWFRVEDQMQEFCLELGLPMPGIINTTKHLHYRRYYDDELAERIGDMFARDIVLGGYKF